MQTPCIDTFDFPDSILAGSTRRGDITDASDPYAGFSLCHYTGDSPARVEAARKSLARWAGIETAGIIVPRQTHGTRVAVIGRLPADPSDLDDADAVVTTLPDVLIGVNTADCVPVVLADTSAGIIAAAHAGWRGAVAGITDCTIDCMTRLGATAENIRAVMGPCIGVECFEVGEEVAARFPEQFINRSFGPKPHVDLPAFVAWKLAGKGIPPHNITLPAACTRCNPSHYFSARAAGIKSGRNFTFIMMRE